MATHTALTHPFPDSTSISFLHLPPEIRHQIYLEILTTNPFVPRAPPGYPPRLVRPYTTVPLPHLLPSTKQLLPSSRGTGYIPHTLLRTCKQIYAEARPLPFATNEFVFDTWMTDALAYAAVFLRGLAPWQRAALRYVRIHAEAGWFADGHAALGTWIRVCGLFSGVEGLRLQIVGEGVPGAWFEVCGMGEEGVVVMKEDWNGSGGRWIVDGLRKMEALRRLEVEMGFFGGGCFLPGRLPPEGREAVAGRWMGKLEEMVNEGREEDGKVVVVGVRSVC
jgi:hypothetical protein